MSEHTTTLSWKRSTQTFEYGSYIRDHDLTFGTGTTTRLSAAREYKGNAALPNPEELLVAALSSCHMLTFLAVAARDGLVVDAYEDEAVGVLEKNASGRTAVTRVTLRPRVSFGGAAVDRPRLDGLHEAAHRGCFIAASVQTEVTVEPRL